jgi:hypothetical protein
MQAFSELSVFPPEATVLFLKSLHHTVLSFLRLH